MRQHSLQSLLVHTESRVALGSPITFTVVAHSDYDCSGLFRQLWHTTLSFERRCSRFLPDSELSQLNRQAGSTHPISQELRSILQAACDMSTISQGYYNPFILPALQRAGYVRSMVAAYANDPVDDYKNRSVTTGDKLELGDNWARIPYGTALDLGGCGKGYLGDVLAERLEADPKVHGFWLSLGGDVVAGGLDGSDEPWLVGVEDLTPSDQTIAAQIRLAGAGRTAIATSAVTRRGGETARGKWHHIIDPRTNQPADSDVIAATVCAASGLLADVMASCLVIVGRQEAANFLENTAVQGALLQSNTQPSLGFGTLASHSSQETFL